MANNPNSVSGVQEVQVFYAKVLEVGMYIGLLTLLVTFALYIFGAMNPYVPVENIAHYWHLPVGEYLHTLNIPHGWGWAGLLEHGDFVNFIGIAVLAGVTIVCFLSVIPTLLRNNDKVYAGFALAEALILGMAASGILAVGH
jgi:hypothetical protein